MSWGAPDEFQEDEWHLVDLRSVDVVVPVRIQQLSVQPLIYRAAQHARIVMLQDRGLVDIADIVDHLDCRHRAGSVVVDPGSLISDKWLVWGLIEDGCVDSPFGSQRRLCMQVCYVA